ncbi:E3 ubiquitin-protein ligase RNF213, partial [Fulmarus glacialis]
KKKSPSEKVHEATEKTCQTKGPEVARKDDASAVTDSCKDKKPQRNQKPVDKIVESDGVTVYFHAILSKDFNLNPETHKVFIKAEGISPYEDWKDNICELNCTKHLEQHGYL